MSNYLSIVQKNINLDNEGNEVVSYNELFQLYDYIYSSSRMSDNPPVITGKIRSVEKILFQAKEEEDSSELTILNPFTLFVKWKEQYFSLSKPPIVLKNNQDERYEYELTFVSPIQNLKNKLFVDIVSDDANVAEQFFSNSTTFSFAVTAKEYAERLNVSLKPLGFCIYTNNIPNEETKIVSIDKISLFDAIKLFYDTFELNYYYGGSVVVNGVTYQGIFIKEFDNVVNDYDSDNKPIPFEYGATNEFMSITKTPSSESIITRITGTGSEDNIPYYYPNETPKGGYLSVLNPTDNSVSIIDKDILNDKVDENDYFERVNILSKIENSRIDFTYNIDYKWFLGSRSALRLSTSQKYETKHIFTFATSNVDKLYFRFDWDTFIDNVKADLNHCAETIYDTGVQNYVIPFYYTDTALSRIKQGLARFLFDLSGVYYDNDNDISNDSIIDIDEFFNNLKGSFFDFVLKDKEITNQSTDITLLSIDGYYSIPNKFFDKKDLYVRLKNRNGVFLCETGFHNQYVLSTIRGYIDTLLESIYSNIVNNTYIAEQHFSNWETSSFAEYVHFKSGEQINDIVLDFGKYGLKVENYTGRIDFERTIPYINPSPNLMPSIYRLSNGDERFYDAINYPTGGVTPNVILGESIDNGRIVNDLYKESVNQHYVFDNPLKDTSIIEKIIELPDIKPSIVGMTYNGHSIDKILDVSFDCLNDDGSVDWERENEFEEINGNLEYKHPYFFVKLPALGFNLFKLASEKGNMSISMTSGHSASCTFEIGVSKSQKNYVAIDFILDDSGAIIDPKLKRDINGNVICNRVVYTPRLTASSVNDFNVNVISDKTFLPEYFDYQNDTTDNEVWIALKKDLETFGTIMPSFANSINRNDSYVILNIQMPFEYVQSAEERLSREIIKELYELNKNKVGFNLNFSSIFFEEDKRSKIDDSTNWIVNKLTENSCVYVKYLNLQYSLYVDSYQYSVSSNSPLPNITITVKDNVTPKYYLSLRGLLSDTTYNNRYVSGINRGTQDILKVQKTNDNIGVGTASIVDNMNEIATTIVTSKGNITPKNFGVNDVGDLVFKSQSQKGESLVTLPDWHESVSKDLESLKNKVSELNKKASDSEESKQISVFYWGNTSTTNDMMSALMNAKNNTLNVIFSDYDTNTKNNIVGVIDNSEDKGSTTNNGIISYNEAQSGKVGYLKNNTYQIIFDSRLVSTDDKKFDNGIQLQLKNTGGKKDIYSLPLLSTFIVEINVYENDFSYIIKNNVPSESDEDYKEFVSEVETLKTTIKMLENKIRQVEVTITEKETEKTVEWDYTSGTEYKKFPTAKILANTAKGQVQFEGFEVKVYYISNNMIKVMWNKPVNGVLIIE